MRCHHSNRKTTEMVPGVSLSVVVMGRFIAHPALWRDESRKAVDDHSVGGSLGVNSNQSHLVPAVVDHVLPHSRGAVVTQVEITPEADPTDDFSQINEAACGLGK